MTTPPPAKVPESPQYREWFSKHQIRGQDTVIHWERRHGPDLGNHKHKGFIFVLCFFKFLLLFNWNWKSFPQRAGDSRSRRPRPCCHRSPGRRSLNRQGKYKSEGEWFPRWQGRDLNLDPTLKSVPHTLCKGGVLPETHGNQLTSTPWPYNPHTEVSSLTPWSLLPSHSLFMSPLLKAAQQERSLQGSPLMYRGKSWRKLNAWERLLYLCLATDEWLSLPTGDMVIRWQLAPSWMVSIPMVFATGMCTTHTWILFPGRELRPRLDQISCLRTRPHWRASEAWTTSLFGGENGNFCWWGF